MPELKVICHADQANSGVSEHDSLEASPALQRRIAVVIPVYNDWESLSLLLPALDSVLGSRGLVGDVVLVDDGSVLAPLEQFRRTTYHNLCRVDLLRLRRNLGHQRAIAVGLVYVHETCAALKAIIVMDGDGEDKPEDVPMLLDELARHDGTYVIFAARTKRLEHWTFRVMYTLYRIVHWLLTGIAIRVGNFSALSPQALHRLVIVSELWNHYAASVFRSRIPFEMLPLARGRRYCGHSQMRFPALVLHGLSAVSVFSDIVGVRLLVFAGLIVFISGVLLSVVIALRLFTNLAIPGWATTAAGLLVIVLVQMLLLMLVLSFIILGNRSHVNLIPLRDAKAFLDGVERLFEVQ